MQPTKEFIIDQNLVLSLVERYQINIEDVLLIALNMTGVSSELEGNRFRMLIQLDSRPESTFRIVLASGRRDSPFILTKDRIYFQGNPFATVKDLENDDVVLAYLRQGGNAITLNSNARSSCTGCVFCYTTLEDALDPRLKMQDDLGSFFDLFMRQQDLASLSHMESVTLSTGCFIHEKPATEHLKLVRHVLNDRGFSGRLNFLSSVIRSEEAFDLLAKEVAPFQLTLTIECFTNRDVLLKRSKADLTIDEMANVLSRAKSRGLDANFTLVLGLDGLEETSSGLHFLRPHITKFPYVNMFQAHNAFMDGFRAKGASTLEWFLQSRKKIEDTYDGTGFCPTTWECYRSLWYFTYAGVEIPDAAPGGVRW